MPKKGKSEQKGKGEAQKEETPAGAKAETKSVGSRKLERQVWEGAKKVTDLPPINGHTGIFAYHMDDCLCSMGGWPCFRDGDIWSCCGSTDMNSHCSKADKK